MVMLVGEEKLSETSDLRKKNLFGNMSLWYSLDTFLKDKKIIFFVCHRSKPIPCVSVVKRKNVPHHASENALAQNPNTELSTSMS